MVAWLKDCKLEAQRYQHMKDHVSMVLTNLKIIFKASELSYSDVLEPAVDAMSRYSSKLYTKPYWTVNVPNNRRKVQQQTCHALGGQFGTPHPAYRPLFVRTSRECSVDFGDASEENVLLTEQVDLNQKQCVEVFSRLPESIQNTIRKARLADIENNKFTA